MLRRDFLKKQRGVVGRNFVLHQGTKFAGLRLRAEIEVKGMHYPVQWAYRQKLNQDGSLPLRH